MTTQLLVAVGALAVGAALTCGATALWLLWAGVRQREERATGCAIAVALSGLFWAALALGALQLLR